MATTINFAEDLLRQGLQAKRALEMERALTCFESAAKLGQADAQVELAQILLYGIACNVDVGMAVEWLERAEASHHPIASYLLAMIACGGGTLPRDARMDARLLVAANAGLNPALLASAVYFGRMPQAVSQTLCMELLGSAAAKGNVVAALLLERRLELGEGCERDAHAAYSLRRRLMKAGMDPLPDTPFATPGEADGHAPRALQASRIAQVALSEISVRPRIAICDRLLSSDECRLLIAHARMHLRPSRALHPVTGEPLGTQIRTSSGASFDPLLEDVALRLVQARMAATSGVPLLNAEHLTVLRYAPGEEYRPHRDALSPASIKADRPESGNRLRTICVYLNPVESGGQTHFPSVNRSIEPRPGSAVVFDNLLADGGPDPDSLHAGLPVERGEKWLATLWLRERRYREF